MKKDNSSFIAKIRNVYQHLNTTQRRIADFYLNSDLGVAFLTTREVAKKVGCSNASVSRFAKNIGYQGFIDMQESIKDFYQNQLNPLKALEDSVDYFDGNNDFKDIFVHGLETDINALKKADQYISINEFENAIDKINKTNKIFIFAIGIERTLANFLEFRLKRFGIDVYLLTRGSSELYDEMHLINEESLVIAIGFYRYPPELDILFDHINSLNVDSILITDDPASPYIEKSTLALAAPRGPAGVMHSLVVPMSILNTLIICLGTKDKYQNNMEYMEDIRRRFT